MVNIGIPGLRHLRQKPTLKRGNRASFISDDWRDTRIKFAARTAAGGLAFIVWFFVCCAYLYGTLFLSPGRHQNFHILALDYDGGVVGRALPGAYQQFKGSGFPTLDFRPPADFPDEAAVRQSVRRGQYWGAIYATANASRRLEAAIQGGPPATAYRAADALHYVWNEQYYTTYADSVVHAGLQQLVTGAGIAYAKLNGTKAFPFVAQRDPAAVQAFLNPINATPFNIKAVPQGVAVLLTTVSMAMPVLQQFFFLLVLNGVCREYQLYDKMTVRSSLVFRRTAGVLFTLGAALAQTGYFWAFREGWHVNGNQFVLSWLVLWLLMHIHLLILDAISVLAPLPVMPFVLIPWVFVNIAATLSPPEIQAGFYHWGIALPSHNAYSALVTIWSGGADNRLYRALPVLFAWLVVAVLAADFAHVRACHLAYRLREETDRLAALDEAGYDDDDGYDGYRPPHLDGSDLESPPLHLGALGAAHAKSSNSLRRVRWGDSEEDATVVGAAAAGRDAASDRSAKVHPDADAERKDPDHADGRLAHAPADGHERFHTPLSRSSSAKAAASAADAHQQQAQHQQRPSVGVGRSMSQSRPSVGVGRSMSQRSRTGALGRSLSGRDRTVAEDVALVQRQVYGPSIPPIL